MLLLAVNSGSSTLKFRLYEMPEEKLLLKEVLNVLVHLIVIILLELMKKRYM